MNAPINSSVRQFVLFVIGVIVLLLLIEHSDATSFGQSFLSPLPLDFCVQVDNGQVAVAVDGYTNHPDGSTTISFSVSSSGRYISYVALGVDRWTRLTPLAGNTHPGGSASYRVEWTGQSGAPGFRSVKFVRINSGLTGSPLNATMLAAQSQAALPTPLPVPVIALPDEFAVRVSGFHAATPIQLEVATIDSQIVMDDGGGAMGVAAASLTAAGAPPLSTPLRLSFELSNPACNKTPMISPLPTPEPTFAPPPEPPKVNVYILSDEDFTTPLSDAEKIEMWNQGLPVPVTQTVASVLAFKPGLMTAVSAPFAQSGEGWMSMFGEDFVSEFPPVGQHGDCQLALATIDTSSNQVVTDYQWGHNNYRSYKVDAGDTRSGAAWPFAGGTAGGSQKPGVQTYPQNRRTQIICTFTGLTNNALKNVMTEFALWLDSGNPYVDVNNLGDFFFVGFNTGEALYYGYRWYSTPFDLATNDYLWQRYRFFYPELADKVRNNNGVLKIMWSFSSDAKRVESARGAWLDNLMVDRYIQPQASVNCQTLMTDTQQSTIYVPGAPGSGMVSKGLILPPDSNDNSWKYGLDPALLVRLNETETDWVRLEFMAQPSAFHRLRNNNTTPGTIDLKHYDRLIDALCANKIATLGLLSYQLLADKSWERPDGEGEISDSYLNTFTRTTALLVSYYGDRIRAWEVWNEPDYDPTGLAAQDFARLLIGVKPIITAANDRLVFGGLGNVDDSARQFMDAFYVALRNLGNAISPFDVFGLHVYPSQDYTDGEGKMLLNPEHHWHAESPTIFAGAQRILQGENELFRDDSDKDIWLTEFGWNGAKGSQQDIENKCPIQESQWVDKYDQKIFIGPAFDILFKETAWPNSTRPSITKAFWYQYQDTSSYRRRRDCFSGVTSADSPSWWVSGYRRGLYPAASDDVLVNWWFGLYDGNLAANPSLCTFRNYPEWATCYQLDTQVYLPTLSGQPAVAQ